MFRDKVGTHVWWKWNHICISLSCWLSNLHQEWQNYCKKSSLKCVCMGLKQYVTIQVYRGRAQGPTQNEITLVGTLTLTLPLFLFIYFICFLLLIVLQMTFIFPPFAPLPPVPPSPQAFPTLLYVPWIISIMFFG